jgi:hypothetical protein
MSKQQYARAISGVAILLSINGCTGEMSSNTQQPDGELQGQFSDTDEDIVAPPQQVSGAYLTSGTLVAADEEAPLSGAEVFVMGVDESEIFARATETGFFELSLPEGSREVSLVAVGTHNGSTYGVKLDLGATTEARALGQIVAPQTGSISGSVRLAGADSHTGIDVYIPGTRFIAKTNAEGAFNLSGIPAALWPSLRADYSGYQSASVSSIQVTSGQTLNLDLGQMPVDLGVKGQMEIVRTRSIETSLTLDVELTASNATVYQLSESPSFNGEEWLPFVNGTLYSYTFSGPGERYLYARFANANGLATSPIVDFITIETTPPEVVGISYSAPFLQIIADEPESEINSYTLSFGTQEDPKSLLSSTTTREDIIDLKALGIISTEEIFVSVKAINSLGMESESKLFPLSESKNIVTSSIDELVASVNVEEGTTGVRQVRACLSSSEQPECDLVAWVSIVDGRLAIRDMLDFKSPSARPSKVYLIVQVIDTLGLTQTVTHLIDESKPTLSLSVLTDPANVRDTQLRFEVNDAESSVNDLEFAINEEPDPSSVTKWMLLSEQSTRGWFSDGHPLALSESLGKLRFEQLTLNVKEADFSSSKIFSGHLYFHVRALNEFSIPSDPVSRLVSMPPTVPELLTEGVPSVFADELLTENGIRFFASRSDCSLSDSCERFHIVDNVYTSEETWLAAPVESFEYAVVPVGASPNESDFHTSGPLRSSPLRAPQESGRLLPYSELYISYTEPPLNLSPGTNYRLFVRGIGIFGQRSQVITSKPFQLIDGSFHRPLGYEPFIGSPESPIRFTDYSPSSENRLFAKRSSKHLSVFDVVQMQMKEGGQRFTVALLEQPDEIISTTSGIFLAVFNPTNGSWKQIFQVIPGYGRSAIHSGNCRLSHRSGAFGTLLVVCGRVAMGVSIEDIRVGTEGQSSELSIVSMKLHASEYPLDTFCNPKIVSAKALSASLHLITISVGSVSRGGCDADDPGILLHQMSIATGPIETREIASFAEPLILIYPDGYNDPSTGGQHFGMDVIQESEIDFTVFLATKLRLIRASVTNGQFTSAIDLKTISPGESVTAIHAKSASEIIFAKSSPTWASFYGGSTSSIERFTTVDDWASIDESNVLIDFSTPDAPYLNVNTSCALGDLCNSDSGAQSAVITKLVKPREDQPDLFALGVQFAFGGGSVSNEIRSNFRNGRLIRISNTSSESPEITSVLGDFGLESPVTYLGAVNGSIALGSLNGVISIDHRCGPGFVQDSESKECKPLAKGEYTVGAHNTTTLTCSNPIPDDSSYSSFTASSAECPWKCNSGFALSSDGRSCIAPGDPYVAGPGQVACEYDPECICPVNVSITSTCNGGSVVKLNSDLPATKDHLIVYNELFLPVGQSNAISHCENLVAHGFDDWRLPYAGDVGIWNPPQLNSYSVGYTELANLSQLMSDFLVRFNLLFIPTSSAFYWSSTSKDATNGWLTNYGEVSVGFAPITFNAKFVCVRGGGHP